MKFVSPETMRDMDKAAIEAGTPGTGLMDRAGRAIASHLHTLSPRGILFLAGRGNNGGDAFAAARYLTEAQVPCVIWVAAERADIKGDALEHLALAEQREVNIRFIGSTQADWDRPEHDGLPLAELVVDCLLGTGVDGAPRDGIAAAIKRILALPADTHIISVDAPSGLDADSGKVFDPCVRADQTLTLGLPKMAFLNAAAREYTGSIECLDVGLGGGPANNPDLQMIGEPVARRRQTNSHKGNHGHLLCIGGAAGYTGAIGLAARAALRSGAGLVTVATPISQAAIVAATCPEAMVRGTHENETGSMALDGWDAFASDLRSFDAILIGPGMTNHEDTLQLARRCLRDVEVPVVFDADALNVFHGRAHWFAKSRGPVLLTPHPGELARLLALDIKEVQGDRYGSAKHGVSESNATLVLKGSGTLVMNRDEGWINLNGNPALATAGSGDVLSGLLGGLVAQGLTPLSAAREAVYRHGRAGDRAAWRSKNAMIASDLLAYL